MRQSTRRFASALAVLMIASVLSGCGGGDVESATADAAAAQVLVDAAAAKASAAATAARKAKAAAATQAKAAAARKAKAAAAAAAEAAAAEPPPAQEVSYENCAAVRAADADPIHRGDPGYASHLDRDDDGIGCE